jgi:SAM-dependent methyltransferase
MNLKKIKTFFFYMSCIFQGKSLCRILQNVEFQKYNLKGKVIEFGAEPNSKNNFSKYIKNKKKILFADKYIKHKDVINVDLNKNISISKQSFDSVIFFNIMEHLLDIQNAKKQVHKILKKNGTLIGSTPFLYRFHGAPSDYYRFTKPFFENFFKGEFRNVKIYNLGFGPMTSCYSIVSDFSKKIPLLNNFLFIICYLIDFCLSFFVNYKLKDIYPIAIFFVLKK